MDKQTKFEKELDQQLIDPLVEMAVHERPNRAMETDAHYSARLKKQLHHSFNDFKKRFEAGITVLEKHKKWPHDDRLKKASALLNDRSKWDEQVSQNKTLQEIIGFTDEELATFYTEGWESYQKSSFVEASNVFLLLTQLNPKVGAFWSALGAAEEKRGEIQDALNAYILAAELETETLAPYLHGAKCLLLLHKKHEAEMVLHRAIERAEHESHLKKDKQTAEKMLKAIK